MKAQHLPTSEVFVYATSTWDTIGFFFSFIQAFAVKIAFNYAFLMRFNLSDEVKTIMMLHEITTKPYRVHSIKRNIQPDTSHAAQGTTHACTLYTQ